MVRGYIKLMANKGEILKAAIVGFEFEFFSDLSRKECASSISKELRKRVVARDAYHSKQLATPDVWKIEPDTSGGGKMHELVTGPMPYYEAIACLPKILSWIGQNGWTDERCAVQLNFSFDGFKIKTRDKLEHLNRLKFVLGFDEQYVYERFPKRKNSIYARSINSIYPINKFVFTDDFLYINPENYELPYDKYYGVNFQKLQQGYLELRYCGGRGYEKKYSQIMDILSYAIVFTHGVLENNHLYSDADVRMLRMAMREHKKVVNSFSDLKSFFLNYPNIKLSVDLKGDYQVVSTFYVTVREKLFDLIIRGGMKSGYVNYDADVGRYQVKDAWMMKAFPLQGFEVFDSRIQGNISNCSLYRCEVSNSHIVDCHIYGGEVRNTKLINCPTESGTLLKNCYIDARKNTINGEIVGSIIRSGYLGPFSEVSNDTEVVRSTATGEKDKKEFAASDGVVDMKDDPKRSKDSFHGVQGSSLPGVKLPPIIKRNQKDGFSDGSKITGPLITGGK